MHDIHKNLLTAFLRAIPQSNQPAKMLTDLAESIADLPVLFGCAAMLKMLGVVEFESHGDFAQSSIRATSQTAKYALMSIAEYLENDLAVIDDWKARGVDDGLTGNVLDSGVKFLQALEKRRLTALQNPVPARYQKVAQVVIKRHNPQTIQSEILFQFDRDAGRYQLIGGRWREGDGDDLQMTAVREIEEELIDNQLVIGRDYELQLIAADLRLKPMLSPTFGALTDYRFWIYQMVGLKRNLMLQNIDRWIGLPQVKIGEIHEDGVAYVISVPDFADMQISLDDLEDSFRFDVR